MYSRTKFFIALYLYCFTGNNLFLTFLLKKSYLRGQTRAQGFIPSQKTKNLKAAPIEYSLIRNLTPTARTTRYLHNLV